MLLKSLLELPPLERGELLPARSITIEPTRPTGQLASKPCAQARVAHVNTLQDSDHATRVLEPGGSESSNPVRCMPKSVFHEYCMHCWLHAGCMSVGI
jgi:hypothetical protein